MKKCKECKGRGTNPAVYGPVPCPDCRGRGYVADEDGEDEDGMEIEEWELLKGRP
jgi:DnaJ-class molecular chaperone